MPGLSSLPQPLPSAGPGLYWGERVRRMQLSPATRANYGRYTNREPGKPVDYLPIKLDIENVSRCNFACQMCPVSDWPKGKRADDLSLEAFQKIIDEQIGVLEIKLQGLGEPTIQGDDFFRMIRYARERAIWVRTTTNASLLHLRGNIDKLADSDVSEVQISIDGANRETFEAIRRQSDFAQVCKNVLALNDAFERRGLVRTKMWVVVQQANQLQLESLVDLAGDLGFEHLVFSLDVAGWADPKWEKAAGEMQAKPVSDRYGLELVARGIPLGVRVAFWNATGRYTKDRLCPWPFERVYVSSDNRVVPCCVIGNPDTYELGSGKDGITAVWNGPEMAEFRAAHIAGTPPEVCRGCYDTR